MRIYSKAVDDLSASQSCLHMLTAHVFSQPFIQAEFEQDCLPRGDPIIAKDWSIVMSGEATTCHNNRLMLRIPDHNVGSVFAMQQTCGAVPSYSGNMMPNCQTSFNHLQLRVYFATAREHARERGCNTHIRAVGVWTALNVGIDQNPLNREYRHRSGRVFALDNLVNTIDSHHITSHHIVSVPIAPLHVLAPCFRPKKEANVSHGVLVAVARGSRAQSGQSGPAIGSRGSNLWGTQGPRDQKCQTVHKQIWQKNKETHPKL